MQLEKGLEICNFVVTRARRSDELDADIIEMYHAKTGAKLCFTKSAEQNKTFSVTFKTLPSDSTGVFHILEHSVLCGSEKYPVKEPFVDLMKSSLATFLNAMTFPDKTMYPVSSRNENDFFNLMSVYLDAVFAPRLLSDRNIFFQEGIHTEIEGESGAYSYRGVVFNEMKGAMSSLDERIEAGICELLFPSSVYRFNSGGDPSEIPNLTYESFCETYRKFYHPSNAIFFLDGDVPLEKTLIMIDSYLEKYEKSGEVFDIAPQPPVSNEGVRFYEIAAGEDNGKKACLVMGKIIGTWKERTKILAAKVLCDVLGGTNESPLKRAVLSSGLCEDFEMFVSDGIAQPYIVISAKNIADSDSGKIKELITDFAKKTAAKGIDKKLLAASINRLAFATRQTPEPQGIYRAISAMNSMLYGGDPLLYLTYGDTVNDIRRMSDGGGFEELLSDIMTKDGLCVLHMSPSETLGDEERRTEEERIKRETSSLDDDGVRALSKMNKELRLRQETPDPPEMSRLVPTLTLDEVKGEIEYISTEKCERGGVSVIFHKVPTSGIVYLNAYFPLTDFSLSEITRVSFVTELYGELATKNRSAAELQTAIKTYVGSLNIKIKTFPKDGETAECTPYLAVYAGVLEENLDAALPLIAEILTQTKFDDSEKIREIVMQEDEAARRAAVGDGHSLGFAAVRSHYTAAAAVDEASSGYSYIKFLHDFSKNYDEVFPDFLEICGRVTRDAAVKAGLTVSVTAQKAVDISAFTDFLPLGRAPAPSREYKSALPEKVGIVIPSQVSYAVKGYNSHLAERKPDGSLRVASNIVSLSYLWDNIRVRGGAYGTGLTVRRSGNFSFYSYRDPSPAKSLKTYDKTSDFIKEFCDGDEELDRYIISTVAMTEPLCTPQEKGIIADGYFFSGVDDDERRRTREEILDTNRDKLSEWRGMFDKAAKDGAVCVVGNREALSKTEGLEIFEL